MPLRAGDTSWNGYCGADPTSARGPRASMRGRSPCRNLRRDRFDGNGDGPENGPCLISRTIPNRATAVEKRIAETRLAEVRPAKMRVAGGGRRSERRGHDWGW